MHSVFVWGHTEPTTHAFNKSGKFNENFVFQNVEFFQINWRGVFFFSGKFAIFFLLIFTFFPS